MTESRSQRALELLQETQQQHSSTSNPLDLLIIGAGISGVDLAHHVNHTFPNWTWLAVDSNDDLGGTWNTFKYPGIRSDSDMATFAFPFKPWPHSSTLGGAADIKAYVREVAQDAGLLDRLLLSTWVSNANFHSDSGLWEITMWTGAQGTVMSEGGEEGVEKKKTTIWTKRLHFASGYFRHANGFTAEIPGLINFKGPVIHPQRWPNDIDVRAKNVVVIGSGATAITLIPALHKMGARATMLQRTPTYIAPLMETDMISAVTRTLLPAKYAGKAARSIHIMRDMAQYHACQKLPTLARGLFWIWNRRYLTSEQVRNHFRPPYNPWDQRVCKAPDGDVFRAITDGASVVTGKIAEVQEHGVLLHDGRFIDADILVTATGLILQAFGQADIAVDGHVIPMDKLVSYRGMMMNAVPNFSYTIGYLNQSWTLRADMTSRYLVAMWKKLADKKIQHYSPVLPAEMECDKPLLDMKSGYIQRSVDNLPRQGSEDPWLLKHDYIYEARRLLRADHTEDMAFGDDALKAASVHVALRTN